MTVFVSRDFLVIVINNSFKKLSYVSFLAERVVLIFDIYDYVSLQGLFFKCSIQASKNSHSYRPEENELLIFKNLKTDNKSF